MKYIHTGASIEIFYAVSIRTKKKSKFTYFHVNFPNIFMKTNIISSIKFEQDVASYQCRESRMCCIKNYRKFTFSLNPHRIFYMYNQQLTFCGICRGKANGLSRRRLEDLPSKLHIHPFHRRVHPLKDTKFLYILYIYQK